MEINHYKGYSTGSVVDVLFQDEVIDRGTIVSLGSHHASVVCAGICHDVAYNQIRNTQIKTAQNNTIKSDVLDDKEFKLIKDEDSSNQRLVVKYKILSGEDIIWESEEVITNVYDSEYGWSAPDDFDQQKLDMIQQKAEMGFDLLMESYDGIVDSMDMGSVSEDRDSIDSKDRESDEDPEEPEGEPAFAPGEGPDGGGADIDLDIDTNDTSDTGEEVAIEDAVEETEASYNPFKKSILASMKRASELLRNPQHRISPITRKLMKEKGIDSGSTNDLDLAEQLSGSDYEL